MGLGWLTLILTASPTALAAATVEQPVVRESVRLRGDTATYTVGFEVGAPLAGPVETTLVWEIGPRALTPGDGIAVSLDGHVVETISAQRAFQNGTTLRSHVILGALSPGIHMLSIEARLDFDTDCQLDDEARPWVALHAASGLRWQLGPMVPKTPAALVRRWRQTQPTLHVGLPRQMTGAGAAAVVELIHRMGQLQGAAVPSRPSAAADVVLRATPSEPTRHPLFEVEDVVAVIGLRDGTPTITSRAPEFLAGAVRALFDPVRMATCEAFPCPIAAADLPEDPADAQPPNFAWRLGAGGWQRGWQANGPGRHQLQFTWQRPSEWVLTDRPTLDMVLTTTDRSLLDPAMSSVSVSVNDRALGTWPITGESADAQRLRVRIPKDIWNDDAWTFRVDVRLEHTSDRVCAARDDGRIWALFGAQSALVVPHRGALDGIAAWARDARIRRPTIAVQNDVAWDHVWELAEVLRPIFTASTEATWSGLVSETDQAAVQLAASEGPHGTLLRDDQTVTVRSAGDGAVRAPTFHRLTGLRATFAGGRWLGSAAVGDAEAPDEVASSAAPKEAAVSEPTPAASPPLPPAESKRPHRWWVDLLSLLAGGGALILGALWIWRGWRRRDAGDEMGASEA